MLVAIPARGQSITLPLADGDRGTEQTIQYIRQLVDQGVKDPTINHTAIDIVRSVPAHDDLAEVRAIYNWVRANVRFVKDIADKETLRPAGVILDVRAGDCDDINAILLPALLGTIGYRTRVVTIASNPAAPEVFSHVYCEVLVSGQWIALDAARPGAVFGRAPDHYSRKRIWSLSNAAFQDVSMGRLGFDWGALADVIAKGSQAASGVITSLRLPQAALTQATVTPSNQVALTYGNADQKTQQYLLYGGLGLLAVLLMTSLRKG